MVLKPRERKTAAILLAAALLGGTQQGSFAQVAEVAGASRGAPVSGLASPVGPTVAGTSGSAALAPGLLPASGLLSAPAPLVPVISGFAAPSAVPASAVVTDGPSALAHAAPAAVQASALPTLALPVPAAGSAAYAAPAEARAPPSAKAPAGLAGRSPAVPARAGAIGAAGAGVLRRALGLSKGPSLHLFFDGARRSDEAGAAGEGKSLGDVDAGKVQVFLTAEGREPVAVGLAALGERLAADPAYAKSLNEQGGVRLIVNDERPGALSRSEVEAAKAVLARHGVTAPIEVESIPIDWARKLDSAQAAGSAARSAEAQPASLGRRVLRALAAPVREAAYLARSFRAAFTRPTRSEVIGGLVSKGPAFVLSVLWWTKLLLPLHPVAFAAAVGFSLLLETFHGLWINTWQNLQNIIGRQRGVSYQTFFNFFYMQSTAGLFRVITWAVIAGTVAPWMPSYWRDMGIMVILGTLFGTMGYQGLNSLYNKGRVSRGTRSWIQQGRDLFFLLAGTFFGSGSMLAFWALFTAQQSLDLGLYIAGSRARNRPLAYVADSRIASTDEFQGMYPVRPGAKPQTVREVLRSIVTSPAIKLTLAFMLLTTILGGGAALTVAGLAAALAVLVALDPPAALKALWRRLRGGKQP